MWPLKYSQKLLMEQRDDDDNDFYEREKKRENASPNKTLIWNVSWNDEKKNIRYVCVSFKFEFFSVNSKVFYLNVTQFHT